MSTFTVRLMKRDEVSLIRDWAAAEGWNPGLHDGLLYDTDPDGFFIGLLDDQLVACISCVAYGDSFGFLGQYIVKAEHRGRGYGMEVWRAGMNHLGDRNVGLDGVVAQQDNYRKSGFQYCYNHIRYRGTGGGSLADGVVPLQVVPFEELVRYDRQHFPGPRDDFVRRWIALPGSVALGFKNGDALAGYGVLRPTVEGFKIGPLFADDPAIADALYRSLLASAPGQPVDLDAPDHTVNPNVRDLVRRHGLTEVFQAARMYTKAAPDLPLEQIYGVTTLELG